MPTSEPRQLAEQIASAGQQIIAAPAAGLSEELNKQLNRVLGWPFQAASGAAYDRDGQTTAPFGTLIFTRVQGTEIAEGQPASVTADTLACAIDVSHTLDLEGLRQAYTRIVHAKTLKKSPAARHATYTTITLGVIFAVEAAVPLEQLADELDRLNRQTPNAHWPDMVVIGSRGLISYAVQFPGEPTISGQWMPPAEGALATYVPATYIVMIIKPSVRYTFNQMMHTLLAHLWIFSPGANLPDREAITEGVQNFALTQSGYQYNLAGELRPVPPEHVQGRMLPQRPFLVQDKKGETLATLQFLKWQDGGVLLLRGKLPLEGLMVFLGGAALKKAGTIKREGLQLSHVLPISEQNFQEMLQRIQRQTNMNVRNDPGKFVVQKLADEGASSPFMARLFMGVLKLGETLGSEKQGFEAAYHPLIMTLLEIRTTAKELSDTYADHAGKIAAGTIVQRQGPTIHIDESIDRQLAKKVDEFLTSATRSFKDRMQRLTAALGVNIGFLYQKPDSFERGVAAFAQVDARLAAYLREARRWGDALVRARNDLEHDGWQLPRIAYAEEAGTFKASEPTINSQPVTEFVNYMTDRLMRFVEDVTVRCIQRRLPPDMSITEIPPQQRALEMPMRFQPTLANGGMPPWHIDYHNSAFEAT
jgi:hypothetical protein